MTDTASLPQLITELIRNCEGSDARMRDKEEIIRIVTAQLTSNSQIKTKANWSWAVRACVRQVYGQIGHKTRVPSALIAERRDPKERTMPLPGWSELEKWRITFDDGMEIVALYATLAQLEVAASHYNKRGQANIIKGRYFTALADAMRARGFRAEQTVEEFYRAAA